MQRFIAALILVLFLVGCSEVVLLKDRSYRFIVAFDTETELESILDKLHDAGIQIIDILTIIHGVSCYLNEEQMQSVKNLPSVRYIEPDLKLYMLEHEAPAKLFSSDSFVLTEEKVDWGVRRIRAPEVWATATGRDVRIGIVDTGIATSHPDLQGAVIGGFNAIDGGSYEDDNNHGTYVASVVAARQNGIGIVGVAPDALLYAIKVMRSDGSGYISDVIEGCQWAMEQDIPLINMSLGSDYHSIAIRETMSIAAARCTIIVAAAGNDGERGLLSPARDDVAICVGASDIYDVRAPWSNYGTALKRNGVLAPGAGILAGTKNGQWRQVSGTSIAAPHVTGAFALLMQVHQVEREALRRSILEGASSSDNPDEFIGHGIVDARKALDAIYGSMGL